MGNQAAAQLTRDLVMAVLREAEKPLSVAEVNARIRHGKGVVIHRRTIYTALSQAALQSEAAYDIGDGGASRWYALDTVTEGTPSVTDVPAGPTDPPPPGGRKVGSDV